MNLKGICIIASLVSSSLTLAELPPNIEIVPDMPENVFVPPGFDNNDNAQIVVTGSYLNTCFKTGPSQVRIDSVAKRIYIKNQAYFTKGCWCLTVVVPYVKTIELGSIPAGNYKLFFETTQGGSFQAKSNIPIAVSTNKGPDDTLYALVEDAKIERNGSELRINGTLTNDCMNLKEFKAFYRAKNVIEVLSVVEFKHALNCKSIKKPYEVSLELAPPWKGETLLHIRSLNGQAINKIYNY